MTLARDAPEGARTRVGVYPFRPFNSCLDEGCVTAMCNSMPTPLYTMRLPADSQAGLTAVGKLCGYVSGRTFAARVLQAVASGDLAQLDALRAQLATVPGVQLGLTLTTRSNGARSRVTTGLSHNRNQPTKKHGRRARIRK